MGGVFSYKNGKWKEAMTIGRALRYIVEEHLGDPIGATRLKGYFRDQFEKMGITRQMLQIKSVVVFTHPAVDLTIDDAYVPVVKVKLRKHIPVNLPRLDEALFEKLDGYFGEITLNNR